MKILHICAHLGGGVGKAIAGLAAESVKMGDEVKILMLESPEKMAHVDEARSAGVEVVTVADAVDKTEELLLWADVTVVNWWDHPVMAEFLVNLPEAACRMILWCHVNGCTYPYLSYKFADIFDRVLFTTEYSLKNPLWSRQQSEAIRAKSALVHGMGEFKPGEVEPKHYGRDEWDYNIDNSCYRIISDDKSKLNSNMAELSDFIIGYAGTISYAKMHPQYMDYCEAVIDAVPNVHFLMVGDADEAVLDDVKSRGLTDYFTFTGHVEDVYPYYRMMDVMGYLLRDDNYATTENVILEAFASGVCVIAHDNPPERSIIDNGVTGFLVKTEDEYAKLVSELAYDMRRINKSQYEKNFVVKKLEVEKVEEIGHAEAAKTELNKIEKIGHKEEVKHEISKIEEIGHEEVEFEISKIEKIGCAARKYVTGHYSSEKNCARFMEEARRCMQQPRRIYRFGDCMGDTPFEWFCAFTGEDRNGFVQAAGDRSEADEKLNAEDRAASDRKDISAEEGTGADNKCLNAEDRAASDNRVAPTEDAGVEKGDRLELKEFLASCPDIYLGLTKSSILHFEKYYPYDEKLKRLADGVKELKLHEYVKSHG